MSDFRPQSLAPVLGAIPTGPLSTTIGSESAFTFNAAGDKVALLFQAKTTAVPDLIAFNVASVSVAGTTGNIEATLETVANGDPAGAVTNSATGSSAISTTGNKTISGMAGTASPLTIGTVYAVVLTAGAGWDRTLTIKLCTGTNATLGFPIVKTKDTAGSFTSAGGCNMGYAIALADSGGAWLLIPTAIGPYACALQNFSASTNPDERGNKYVEVEARVMIGVDLIVNAGSTPGANDDYSVRLYSGSTTSPTDVAHSPTMEGEAQSNGMFHRVLFSAPYTTAAGETLRITERAEGSENQSMARWDFTNNGALGAFLGTDFIATTCNDAGSFTDDNDSVYSIFPVYEAGNGGGGGTTIAGTPLMRGMVA